MQTSLVRVDEIFGTVLKAKRLGSGFSQEKLAIEANMSRAYISQLECGLKDPSLFTIIKLSDALKIKSSKFIYDVEQNI